MGPKQSSTKRDEYHIRQGLRKPLEIVSICKINATILHMITHGSSSLVQCRTHFFMLFGVLLLYHLAKTRHGMTVSSSNHGLQSQYQTPCWYHLGIVSKHPIRGLVQHTNTQMPSTLHTDLELVWQGKPGMHQYSIPCFKQS